MKYANNHEAILIQRSHNYMASIASSGNAKMSAIDVNADL